MDAFPALIRPMLAVSGELPAAKDEARWAVEMKWDGVRAVVYLDGPDRPRAITRNDRDVAGSYPEVAALAASLGRARLVLDGELVALDETGRPDFGLLQQRMHVTGPALVSALADAVPVTFLAFDLLYAQGHLLLDRTYDERRMLLESLDLEGPRWAVPPAFAGAGAAALAVSRERRLEGVVAKHRDSRYQPGRRSRAWVKVKHVRTQEVVVGGWRPGAGRRSGTVGSLLIGVPDAVGGGGLAYSGHVGTGFTDAMLADLDRLLAPLHRATSPFAGEVPVADVRDAVWVEPVLVGEVAFADWTRDGRLRHPSWRGLRPDKSPGEVTRVP